MKTLQWIAMLLSLIGVWLNIYQIFLCWPIWIVANSLWLAVSIKNKESAQAFVWSGFLLSSIYGLTEWI